MRGAAAIVALALVAIATAVSAAQGEPYPSRPIVLIVPYSPGGVADTLARVIGEKLEASFGEQVLVENRPGAAGYIASELVARAAPDGHTLLLGANSITILPSIAARATDPAAAFAPVTRLVTQPILIVANPALGVRELGDLVALARRAPKRLAYATAGVGTTDHLAAALLWTRAGVDALHVPYTGSAQEIRDLVSGEVQAAFITLGAVRAFLKSGQLRAVAVTSRQRVPALPDVPTVAESGYPGFEILSWFGLLAPTGTPPDVVLKLHREVARIMALPEVRERILGLGAEPVANTPAQFTEEIRAQLAFWPAVVKAAGIARE